MKVGDFKKQLLSIASKKGDWDISKLYWQSFTFFYQDHSIDVVDSVKYDSKLIVELNNGETITKCIPLVKHTEIKCGGPSTGFIMALNKDKETLDFTCKK